MSFSLRMFHSRANRFTNVVSAARKPSSCVPPSWVLIVFANVCTDSLNCAFHCIAISRLIAWPSPSVESASKPMTVRWIGGLPRLRWLT